MIRLTRRAAIGALASAPLAVKAMATPHDTSFRALAPRPPMGWNSWDCFATTINEAQARANAAVMAEKLLPHGYDVFTIDIQWYESGATGFQYRVGAELTMDGWGRLLPAGNRFPSARGGLGFKPLADHIHALGLRFGVHLMRGVPRGAADRNLPILGTPHRCGAIADRVNICPWNPDMYGIDMSKPGAQAYYDSVFRLLAEWGVDFVKVDDISRPYHRNEPEIAAVRRAIDGSGRPMVLSLSPGETPLSAAAHAGTHANMWRISDDFWDEWPLLLSQFRRLANWAPHVRAGTWPDADMLPLGLLAMGARRTRFTPAEQRTMMTLWSIARSPLIMGGDLTALDDAALALLTNDEVLAVNQHGTGGRELRRTGTEAIWIARDSRTGDPYVALFNLGETEAIVSVRRDALGAVEGAHVRDLWAQRDIGLAADRIDVTLAPHGAAFYRLGNERDAVVTVQNP
ncbi:glycoside hydrolase family 27 protein [Sphingosinicella sp. LHD-64]|uniref:glycoside hydrolase family 27 protein n=1 Tax=Sphingosinicella sp. LHD-64 TaxID=3072139 RepID=UPI00280EBEAE|nr:glycoside hydrolase family 27 protein [Sphingosinicella sp. LHD-64]MDQ8755192.1 glycoside hydrolase family 27 protein [Sphingosinicella sp. LHD-64]